MAAVTTYTIAQPTEEREGIRIAKVHGVLCLEHKGIHTRHKWVAVDPERLKPLARFHHDTILAAFCAGRKAE